MYKSKKKEAVDAGCLRREKKKWIEFLSHRKSELTLEKSVSLRHSVAQLVPPLVAHTPL